MKSLRSNFYLVLILVAAISISACKAKKKVIAPPSENPPPTETPAPVQQVAPPAQTPPPPPPAPAPPNYNFSNIQFEFDSGILKTESYPILDKAAAEMKKDPSVTFILKGYASAEGSDEHNMQLSVDRANSVKTYLVNSGVNGANISTKGFGEANPVADNSTEAGRVINRRVEIRKQ